MRLNLLLGTIRHRLKLFVARTGDAGAHDDIWDSTVARWLNRATLKWVRQNHGLSRADVEELSGKLDGTRFVRIRAEDLAKWESGKGAPLFRQLETLAEIYGYPVGYFLVPERPDHSQLDLIAAWPKEVSATVMPDFQIREEAQRGMIRPFVNFLVRDGVVSYGLSSFGYDVRLAPEFLIFSNTWPTVVDPKAMDPKAFVRHTGDTCIIPPNSFVLGRTVEYLKIPDNVIALVLGKSTYARLGIIVNTTPLEPGWEGHITLEISNTTPLPARLYAGEGIAQVVFFRSPVRPEVTYRDRKGVYQGQRGVTLPRVTPPEKTDAARGRRKPPARGNAHKGKGDVLGEGQAPEHRQSENGSPGSAQG